MDSGQIKGIVYKITDNETDKIYIGSTRWYQQRICTHFNFKYGNCSLTKLIKERGKNNFSIEIIKEVIYTDKTELRKEEQNEIEKIPKENIINTNRAYIDPKEMHKIYESLRSPNSENCVQYKLELKRAARRRYAEKIKQRMKDDPVFAEEKRRRNREKQRCYRNSKPENFRYKSPDHEAVASTERAYA